MEAANSLIRTVVRAFYQTRHILVIDALIEHSTLWVDDLAHVLSMNSKELRKLCSVLRDDKLVSVHTRQELREGQQRPQNKEYYYVNYHLAIDAIKLRVVRLEKRVRDLYKPTQERKDWYCPRCKAQYAEMEVLHKFDPKLPGSGFACLRCGASLDRNEVSATDRAGSERSSRLMEQLDRLLGADGLLRAIDSKPIPQNDFEQALSRRKLIDRTDNDVHWAEVKKESTSDIVHGVKVEAPEVTVSFTTEQETEKAEAEKKRQRLEQQEKNVLPAWHTSSTVTGQKTVLGDQEEARMQSIKDNLGLKAVDEDVETTPVSDDNHFISQYYRELEEAKAAELARDDAEEADEDDDDDDEFENVLAADTPASSASPHGAGIKRKADDSDLGSGFNTAASTPAVAESPTKRIKVEEGVADEDDDEEEFEDLV